MPYQTETLVNRNQHLDPIQVDMQPTLESVLALEPPFSFHLIGTLDGPDGKFEQVHVGLGVRTEAQAVMFRERMRTWPVPWDVTIAFWSKLADEEEQPLTPVVDISGRLAPGEIADTIIQTYLETQREYEEDMSVKKQLQEAIDSGMLNADDLHQLLRDAVKSARTGWQRKPF